ncbi:hypothetical protein [Chryseobacterium lactis]|uniref:hypothetical protein n=1 Tax=Chryseobacterium lactis TaxID=1241981 RepID=UPI000F4E1945|nr:hypothetical protein [Chryseobacterium lactis]
MKTALTIILFVNTAYVLAISENQNPIDFIFPLFIYVFFGFFRYYHKEFTNYLNSPNHGKHNNRNH